MTAAGSGGVIGGLWHRSDAGSESVSGTGAVGSQFIQRGIELQVGTLYFFCGKMGAGKSTRAKALATEANAVLISEDEWLATLFPGQINTFEDYLQHAARLRPLVQSLVAGLLRTGASVVMDFPANTPKQRRWFIDLAESAGASSKLFYLQVSDEACLTRIAKRRREQPERAIFDNEQVFNEVSKFFKEPDASEALDMQVIKQGDL